MGIVETFCNGNGTSTNPSAIPDFVQQPIVQANHFEFAAGYIELSSATGKLIFFALIKYEGTFFIAFASTIKSWINRIIMPFTALLHL
jgi:hypothetical protein